MNITWRRYLYNNVCHSHNTAADVYAWGGETPSETGANIRKAAALGDITPADESRLAGLLKVWKDTYMHGSGSGGADNQGDSKLIEVIGEGCRMKKRLKGV